MGLKGIWSDNGILGTKSIAEEKKRLFMDK
jgi:hypothetical protein